MNTLLLRIKNWQLLILILAIPIIIDFILIYTSVSDSVSDKFNKLLPVSLFQFTIVILWEFSIANLLHKSLPKNVKMNFKRFKIFFFIPVFYIISIGFLVIKILSLPVTENIRTYIIVYLFTIPIQFFSIFCIFYSIYFISKSLKSVELQKEVNFNEHILEFFLLFFFPFGLWLIQPRINEIYSQYILDKKR